MMTNECLRTLFQQVAPLSWLKFPDVGIPCPDKVFYLKLSAEAAEKRAIYGMERYEKVTFQQKVEEQFEKMKGQEWETFDASRDIESLHSEILERALSVIKECQHKTIAKLWTDMLSETQSEK